jgi:S-adenosylmethionine uptake transporter
VTFRELSTRRLSPAAPSLLVALVGSAGVMIAALVAMTGQRWSPLDADAWVGLAGTSFFVLGAYVLSVSVMRVGEIGFVAPFRYTGLLWALVLGWVAFDDWPDNITLVGAAIVMATGVFTLWRERRSARRAILTQARPARLG